MGNNTTIIVAMSGGVDSSVAAGLLKRDGHEVVGATLRLNPCQDDGNVRWCCGKDADEQARAVAGVLSIPHYSVDAVAEFEDLILKPSWEEYNQGRTPSPCIVCNREIKFRLLLDLARKLGASKIATGHYARIDHDDNTGSPLLLRGIDTSKDQSYFLFDLSKDSLNSAIFPLGGLHKKEVRDIAASMGFANAKRPESQDACFVHAEGSFAEGLRIRFDGKVRTGNVVDLDGNKLGEHSGIHHYTVGQRKGLGIALGRKAYVSKIDAETGNLVLCDNPDAVKSRHLTASKINWVGDFKPTYPLQCQAQIRYRHRAADATAKPGPNNNLLIEFDQPQNAIAPGQAVVLYDGERVLGGGWID